MANTVRFQLRSDTTENWESVNPVLLRGELGLDLTANRLKIGDGTRAWKDLPYVKPEVIDKLTSSSKEDALSARQGRRLQLSIPTVLNSLEWENETTSALSAAQGYVLKGLIDEKADGTELTELQQTVNNINPVSVVNTLTSTSTVNALSANQGRVLNSKIPAVVNSLTSTSTTSALSANQGKALDAKKLNASDVSAEEWTFTLSDGSTVTKKVALWIS